MKRYVGFDPGKSGHGVMIDDQGTVLEKFPYPVIGKEYDIQGMLDIFDQLDRKTDHIIIEDVKALQKPMQAGNWSLSRGKTILEVCAAAYGIPHTLVHSKTWQKEIWQGVPLQKKAGKTDTKAMTLIAIKRLFPHVSLLPDKEKKYYGDTAQNRKLGRVGEEIPSKASKPDDGIVDALAMAEYGRRRGL